MHVGLINTINYQLPNVQHFHRASFSKAQGTSVGRKMAAKKCTLETKFILAKLTVICSLTYKTKY